MHGLGWGHRLKYHLVALSVENVGLGGSGSPVGNKRPPATGDGSLGVSMHGGSTAL